MKVEDICTDLKLSIQLKEAGFPQDNGIYYWHRIMYDRSEFDSYEILPTKISDPDNAWKGMYKNVIRALTTDELLEVIPKKVYIKYWNCDIRVEWGGFINVWLTMYVYEEKNVGHSYGDKKLANALAKLWLWLREKELI